MLQTETWRDWIPADGDTFTTEEGFIFNVFGYEHPEDRVLSFLKYIPSKFRQSFNLQFLERTWKYGSLRLLRAEKLYTAENYRQLLRAFRKDFPHYIYFCPFREKDVVSSPLNAIKRVYAPRPCLNSLKRKRKKDKLQKTALSLLELLSVESNIPMHDFGIHGSIALNMHTPESDIDFVVYGTQNFRGLEITIDRLVEEGTLSYVISNRLDAARLFKGRYSGTIFMYNAVRKPEEIHSIYGTQKYSQIKHVNFKCAISDDREAVFRPAIYKITDYQPKNPSSTVPEHMIPKLVVSMIGCYRNIAKQRDEVEVSGMLEQVEDIKSHGIFHQVVVGTGENEDEYIWPSQS